jgi:hypothetical protein
MHQKVRTIIKELPWITEIHPLITSADLVQVERLDVDMLDTPIGKFGDWSTTYGYFVDKKGVALGRVHPAVIDGGIANRIKRFALRMMGTLDEAGERNMRDAVRELHDIDRIRYVILISDIHEFDDGHVALIVVKLPSDSLMSELVREYDIEIAIEQSEETLTLRKLNS